MECDLREKSPRRQKIWCGFGGFARDGFRLFDVTSGREDLCVPNPLVSIEPERDLTPSSPR
jgi:hypothetical protein